MMRWYCQWIAFQTIVIKDVTRVLRIWTQTILPSVITTVLYFVIFGHVIGYKIGNMDGVPYIRYIIPGLIMMSVITNAFANVVSSFFGAKYGRSIEEVLVSPTSHHIIILGYISGGIVRGTIVGALVTLVSMIFSPLHISHPVLMAIVVLLSTVLFALGGLINGIFAKKFDDINIIPVFVLTPLTFLGGVFYSTKLLPLFWQKVSLFNPIIYIINAFRYSMVGISDVSFFHALELIAVFIVLFYGVCWYLLSSGTRVRL